jgi:hypothetical protein
MINGSDGRIRNHHIPAKPHEYLGGRAAGISGHARPRDFVGYCDRSSWRGFAQDGSSDFCLCLRSSRVI